jgi:hypothetical protein
MLRVMDSVSGVRRQAHRSARPKAKPEREAEG